MLRRILVTELRLLRARRGLSRLRNALRSAFPRVVAFNFDLLELDSKPHGTRAQYLLGLNIVAVAGFVGTGFPARAQIRLGHAPPHGAPFDIGGTREFSALALAAPGFARAKTLQRHGGLERIGSLVESVSSWIVRARRAHVVEPLRQVKRMHHVVFRDSVQGGLRDIAAGTEQLLQARDQIRACVHRIGGGAPPPPGPPALSPAPYLFSTLHFAGPLASLHFLPPSFLLFSPP